MIGSIALVSGLLVFIIIPFLSLFLYYSPKQFSTWTNVVWVIVGIITWPIIPVVLFVRNRNMILNAIFWISLIVFVISANMWLFANLNLVIEFLRKYSNINVSQ